MEDEWKYIEKEKFLSKDQQNELQRQEWYQKIQIKYQHLCTGELLPKEFPEITKGDGDSDIDPIQEEQEDGDDPKSEESNGEEGEDEYGEEKEEGQEEK